MQNDQAVKLRSRAWFGGDDMSGFVHRAYLRAEGFSRQVFSDKPVIGICNSWSELTTCNAHLRQVAEAVKRGVWEAGGFPLEFPTISLGEILMKPTTMLYRNLMAMDVEECLRAYPLDAVVLLPGCDKTTPAQLMGLASADIPGIMVPGGPMLSGMWRGQKLGSGTDTRRFWAEKRAGRLTDEQWCEIEGGLSRSAGPLHGDGYGVDYDEPGGSVGHDVDGLCEHPRSRFAPPLDRRAEWQTRSGNRA